MSLQKMTVIHETEIEVGGWRARMKAGEFLPPSNYPRRVRLVLDDDGGPQAETWGQLERFCCAVTVPMPEGGCYTLTGAPFVVLPAIVYAIGAAEEIGGLESTLEHLRRAEGEVRAHVS